MGPVIKIFVFLFLILILLLKFAVKLKWKEILRVIAWILLITLAISVIYFLFHGLFLSLLKKPWFWIGLVILILAFIR